MAQDIYGKPDKLRDTMLERAKVKPVAWEGPFSATGGTTTSPTYPEAAAKAPTAPTGLPATTPTQAATVPPDWQRYLTGLRMQHAYANNWQPNPMLVRLLSGEK